MKSSWVHKNWIHVVSFLKNDSFNLFYVHWCEGIISDPLELELSAVVSRHVGAGNLTHVSGRTASALNH